MLLDTFPSIKNDFIEETEWQEGIDTGSTVVYEDVFMSFVLKAFENEEKEIIDCIFRFIEELSLIDGEYVQNVVHISIIDNFHYYDDTLDIRSHLKYNSLKIYNEISI